MPRRFQFSLRALLVLVPIYCLVAHSGTSAQTKPPVNASRDQPAPTPKVQITEKPLPSVKEAISKAIDHTRAHQLFLSKSIEIAATKEPDGTVKVVFSRPTSDIIAAEGRLPTKRIVEVQFTEEDVPPTQPEHEEKAEARERADALANAARAVCSKLAARDKMEFAVSASKNYGGFFVLVESIPYTPGAHRLYKLSKDFQVVREIGGR